MSRAERRAYKRMTKNQDPYALPGSAGTRGRVERQRARRRQPSPGTVRFWSARMLTWTLGGALAAGLIAFSIAWPSGMPFALYVGVGAALAWAALALAIRAAQRRASAAAR
ncbi:MAG: hypothetical protein ACRDHD_06320 [Candidatus Limnocylindria bacterium]